MQDTLKTSFNILQGINFCEVSGELVDVIGPNGAERKGPHLPKLFMDY
jgi:ABC-type Mn2+/Zn2+ transport system ATPase subunit